MTVKFVIPSKGRSREISQWTLASLERGGIPPEQVDVWVPRAEVPLYEARCQGNVIAEDAVPGFKGVRNWIAQSYDKGTKLVSLDDDIKKIIRLRSCGHTTYDVTDLAAHVDFLFDLCEREGLGLWGTLSQSAGNPNFFADDVRKTAGRMVVATFSGWTVNNDKAEVMTVEGVGEDVERTARFIRRDGAILFAAYLGTINAVPIGRLYDRGSEKVAQDWRTLETLYPDVVRIDWSRKYPRPLMLRSPVTKFAAPPHGDEPPCKKCAA